MVDVTIPDLGGFISFLKLIELFFQSLPLRAGAGSTCMDGSNDYVMLYLTSGDDLGANDFLSLKVLSCPLRLYFSLAEDDSAFTIVLVLVFLFTLLDFVLSVNHQTVVWRDYSFVFVEP